MLLGNGNVGAPCRRLAAPLLQHPTAVQRSCIAQAGRDRARERSPRSTGPGVNVSSSAWLLPTSLVSERRVKDEAPVSDPEAPLTVYTIRFTTGIARGSALSEPYSAVNVCLVGQDGVAAMHRVSPVNDPIESRDHTVEMCQIIGPEVGADCSGVIADASASNAGQPLQGQARGTAASSSSGGMHLVGRPPPPPPPKRRFQEGSVDEVSILVPELGPLSRVLVGVEGGTWYLDEMDVVSSRTQNLDRFVCRRTLGGKAGEGAALLTPVPVGAVVYGEGEAAVVLTKEQASALWSLNMSDYGDMKRRVAATTTLLVASGASLAALTGGTAAALPYTAGGVVGLVYQWMLMRGVDHVMEAATGQQKMQQTLSGATLRSPGVGGDSAAYPATSADSALAGTGALGMGGPGSGILGSAPVRLGFVCASAALGLTLLSQEEAATTVTAAGFAEEAAGYGPMAAWQLALGALGFLTYKVAMVGVSLGDAGSSSGGLALAAKVLQRSVTSGGNQTELGKYKRD